MNTTCVARIPSFRQLMTFIITFLLLGAIPGTVKAADFNSDGVLDIADIDALVMEIIAGTNGPSFDLTGDGLVNTDDLAEWRAVAGDENGFAGAYLEGDANLDGDVNASDLNELGLNWQASPNTWSGGDFNASGFVDAVDLNLLALNWQGNTPGSEAQLIGWEPLVMDFGLVPVGNLADGTLRLTATGPEGTLAISEIYFTFNDRDAFGVSAPVPAVLLPGESIDVDLSFNPPDFSFFFADLRILNNSSNAPELSYFFSGFGEFGTSCTSPLVNCGGVCVDLSSDLGNCGSCGNVCVAPEHAEASCQAASCGFVCDYGYEPFNDGCRQILIPTTIEMLEELIIYVDGSVVTGALVGLGPRSADDSPSPHRLQVFLRTLERAMNEGLATGNYDAACDALNFAQLRSDGGYPSVRPPDFVTGDVAPYVNDRINEIMGAIDGCDIRDASIRQVN